MLGLAWSARILGILAVLASGSVLLSERRATAMA
jgi:hypothetical protein